MLFRSTPFNQASSLVKEHEDKWTIVAGMNLPMVIEALTQRFSVESAREIARAIVPTGNDGIKTFPEDAMPVKKEADTKAVKTSGKKKTIPEGTVLGDGHIKYVLAIPRHRPECAEPACHRKKHDFQNGRNHSGRKAYPSFRTRRYTSP